MSVVVIGQIGRDLVLRTDGPPLVSESTTILQRKELLGGKGANQAVGLAQLGVPVALIGVVGEDFAGTSVLRQAEDDGIDIGGVVRRGTTALLIDIVGEPPKRLLLEHVPEASLVQVADLDQSSTLLDTADTVSIQLQQPAATALAAAQRAQRRGLRVVADGAPAPGIQDELLYAVDAIRADATEAALIAGKEVTTVEQATKLANHLLKCGPKLVALAVPDVGDLLTWNGGSELFGFADVDVVDPTGAGDAFVAGLISALRDGAGPRQAGRRAAAAASSTVQRLGGRPDLTGLADRPEQRVAIARAAGPGEAGRHHHD
jgi:ribokinase